jgi:uncharacterized protein YbaP (TraB family)
LLSNNLFWHLKNHEQKEIYIFGTAHIYSAKMIHSLNKIEPYLEKSSIFFAEFDLNELEYATVQQKYSKLIHETKKMLSLRRIKQIQNVISKHFGIQLNNITNQHPFHILQIISQTQLDKDHDQFMDAYLWKMATNMGLELHGLETFSSQLHYLELLERQCQWGELKRICQNPTKYKRQLKNLINAYERQELRNLYEMSLKSLGKARKYMIKDRNLAMCSTLINCNSENPIFVAVGAAHLPGKFGLLRLLKHNGYRPEPIPFDGFV